MASSSKKAIHLSASNPSESVLPADGIVAINKDAGWTSHDVVARLRRLLHMKRVGHAGTLDPAATGVLPVCFGQATRLVEYLSDSGKAYRATITFGTATNTYDGEGEVVATAPLPTDLAPSTIAAAFPAFLGEIMQVPPAFSALKRNGQRLYDLARAGITVDIPPRPVQIFALEIVAWASPVLVLDVACGKGTYIRSLAHDLGQALGTVAHLSGLVRTRVGPFTLDHAVTVETLAAALTSDRPDEHLHAADAALLDWQAVILAEAHARQFAQGQILPLGITPGVERLRTYHADGRFLGIMERVGPDQWHPSKVFTAS